MTIKVKRLGGLDISVNGQMDMKYGVVVFRCSLSSFTPAGQHRSISLTVLAWNSSESFYHMWLAGPCRSPE